MVDRQENPVGTIYDLKIYETQKYMSILNYTYQFDGRTRGQQEELGQVDAWAAEDRDGGIGRCGQTGPQALRDNEAVS